MNHSDKKQPVAIFLGSKIDEIGTHGQSLTISQFCHTKICGHVFVGHFITNTPSHVHYLKVNKQLMKKGKQKADKKVNKQLM